MSLLGENLGGEAARHKIEFRGKTYEFKLPDIGILDQLELDHFERRKQRLQRTRGLLAEQTIERKALELSERYGAGEIDLAQFEKQKESLQSMRGLLSEEAITKKIDELTEQYHAGEFGFLAPAGQAWLKTPAGANLLMKLSLGVTDQELIELLLHKGDEVKRQFTVIMRESGLLADKA